MIIRNGILVAFFLLLSGCSLFKGRSEPVVLTKTPESWSTREAKSRPITFWLDEFKQPRLLALIEEAFEKNPNLLSQAAAVQLAQVQARLAGADRWPELSAGLGSSRSKRSGSSGFSLSSVYSTSYDFSLDLSWEVDLWGRLGNGLQAALYEEEAAQADFEAARLSLAANIIKTVFDGIEAREQLKLSRETVENFKNSLQIVENGYGYGLYRALDVRLSRSNLLRAVSQLQSYRIAADQTVRSLEVLLGRYPGAKLKLPDLLPTLNHSVSAGIPVNLLQRRPDIIAAQGRFKALDQRYIEAKKSYLPSIRLAGSGGVSSRELNDFISADQLIWNFTSGLVQPLFQGGRLDAFRDEAAILWQQSEYDYRQTVLFAFQEVETLLSAEKILKEQEAALTKTAYEAHEAELLASEDYVSGLTDINTLLQTQREAFDAESGLLVIRKSRLQNRVNLYLALGGPIAANSAKPDQQK